MNKIILILSIFFTNYVCATELKVFQNEAEIVVLIHNTTPSTISISKNFILGSCSSLANLCLSISSDKAYEIKVRPHNFDHTFSQKIKLEPNTTYGVTFSKEVLKRRFGLTAGEYELLARFKESNEYVLSSNVAKLKIK